MSGDVDRIVLVSLDNLGDLVFASALTPPLRARFPSARIDVWCKAYTADVAKLIPHVSSVIAADPPWAVAPGHARPGVLSFARSVWTVRRNRYDVAVLSEAPWRVAASVRATGARRRIGLARHRNTRFLTDVLPPADPHQPVLTEQARLLSPLGASSAAPRYRLDASALDADRKSLRAVLPPRYVAFHPFAGARDRCVSLAEWTQAAFALAARGLAVLWIGSARELDELRALTHPKGYYADQLPQASLRVTAAALHDAAMFAGHDSGPLHVAGAFGVPVVGVFAPGQPERTFPQGIGPSRLLHRPSPAGISAATLLAEIDALLASAP